MTLPPLVLDGPTWIVSAHLDDAAYSLGGWLASDVGDEVVVASLFGVSDFAPHSPQSHGKHDLATQLRREEERMFSDQAGVFSVILDLPEAALRLRTEPVMLFVSPDEATNDPVLADLEVALRTQVQTARPHNMFIPLAIGGHIDHWLARFAATRIAQEYNCRMIFFEDLPYAGHLTESAVSVVLEALASGMKSFMLRGACLSRKIELLNCYASQVGTSDKDDVIRHYRRIGGERCWWPES